MRTTRILWSGLTGKTGREAMGQLANVPGVEIAGGISRQASFIKNGNGCKFCEHIYPSNLHWYQYLNLSNAMHITKIPRDFDVIVDFSHPDVFDQVLEFAIRTDVPLISGTSGLSNHQMAMLYDATGRIPVFRGGNFRFKVKKFIDEAVEAARNTNGHIILFESFYEGKSLPSETSKVIRRRIYEATGKTIEVYSEANLPKEQLPCNWRLDLGTELRNNLTCHTIGFDELAHDVLEIAKVMATKPIKRGDFYDLDEIWDELPTV